MKIDRERALGAFREYVDGYHTETEKVRLKIEHTYRVAELSEKIALSLGMSKEDVDLAWLVGLLHDFGRFEQLKNYGMPIPLTMRGTGRRFCSGREKSGILRRMGKKTA